jgi:hypothetical protein
MDAMIEKPAELIERYIGLRNQRNKDDEVFAAFRKETYEEPMQAIEMQLLNTLNVLGSDSIKSKAGTAMKVHGSSLTTADSGEFRRHVIGLEAWELVDWRPNKTAIENLIKNNEVLPPGLNRVPLVNVRIRTASSKGE